MCERMKKEELYRYLKTHLTSNKLKELSLKIIDAYKTRNHVKLQIYADSIFRDKSRANGQGNRLFLRLIKFFHPDRLNYLLNDIEVSFENNDMQKLIFYKDLISAESEVNRIYSQRFDIDFSEVYQYDEGDYELFMPGIYEGPPGGGSHEVEEHFDFFTAVKSAVSGNLEFSLDPSDLASLEGELDLSDYNIQDLDGLQYCRNITRLNLSNNCISNIYQIQHLEYLEELFISGNEIAHIEYLKEISSLEILDASYNKIENISPLLQMENLRFVNIKNNPIGNRADIQKLEEKQAIVIF
jgi:Leucine-rich repeat (LRR) protein